MRLLILGPPGAAKTTTARLYASVSMVPVRSTDSLIATHTWQQQIEQVTQWLDDPGPWVIEGVSAVWALRRWLELHSEGTPADLVIWLSTPKVERSEKAKALGKGAAKVWAEVMPVLKSRDVELSVR